MVLCRFCLFDGTATTEIYTLSLHDALPISVRRQRGHGLGGQLLRRDGSRMVLGAGRVVRPCRDRKSTRLNSSHRCTSYAVFCLKKKNIEPPCEYERPPRRERATQRAATGGS